MSVGSNGEDRNTCSTEETDRKARRRHAPRASSPLREREFVAAILQGPFEQDLEYDIPLEEPNGQETRRVEDPDMVRRPGGEPQGFPAPHPTPLEAQEGKRRREVEVRLKKLPSKESAGRASKIRDPGEPARNGGSKRRRRQRPSITIGGERPARNGGSGRRKRRRPRPAITVRGERPARNGGTGRRTRRWPRPVSVVGGERLARK